MRGKDLIITGDFNTTRSQCEKRGGTKVRDSFSEKMEDLMADLDMLDIPLRNGKYTWSNKITVIGNILARLEIFLVSSTFLQKYLLPTSLALPSVVLDHKPIALILSPPANLGPIPFRFNLIWLHDAKIMELIQREWKLQHFGSPNYIWESNLRAIRSSLKKWESTSYSEPTIAKKKTFNQD